MRVGERRIQQRTNATSPKGRCISSGFVFNEFKYSSNITYAYVTSLLYYSTRIKYILRGCLCLRVTT